MREVVLHVGQGALAHRGKPRVIDIDAETVTILRAWRKERGAMALQLARDDALVFGDFEGRHRDRSSSGMWNAAARRLALTRCR